MLLCCGVHSLCFSPGPPLGVGTSLPVLPPYTGHPFRTGLGRAERPSSLTAASDSEAETYTSVGTGQSHFNRVRVRREGWEERPEGGGEAGGWRGGRGGWRVEGWEGRLEAGEVGGEAGGWRGGRGDWRLERWEGRMKQTRGWEQVVNVVHAPSAQPRRHPSSVAIMDELVDPNGSEMQQRKQEAHHDNGGVEVVEPELCDSSTLHSSSLPSIFDSSCAYGPSSQHPYTSADEMYASDTFVSPLVATVWEVPAVGYCSLPSLYLPPSPVSLRMMEGPGQG